MVDTRHVNEIIGTVIVSWAVGVFCRSVLKKSSPLPVPYTGFVLILGLIIGIVLVYLNDTDEGEHVFLSIAVNYNLEKVFYLLLCVPVFSTALQLDVNMLLHEFWHIVSLSLFGSVLSAVFIALFSHYIMGHHFDWKSSMYFGAMCSATDTVAVISKLKEMSSRSRLYILVESEALLNNCAMIILFSLFFNSAADIQNYSVSSFSVEFIRLSVGGSLLGVFVGFISSYIIGYILEDPFSEIMVTVISCFSVFLLSTATIFHVSGITAVMTCGLYISIHGIPRISAHILKPMVELWKLTSFLTRTFVFFMSGILTLFRTFGSDSSFSVSWRDGLYLLLLYIFVYISRFLSMAICYIFFQSFNVSYEVSSNMELRHLCAVWWCGVRGFVSLTLAAIVSLNSNRLNADEAIILFYVCGLVVLSLLLNGSTVKFTLHFIGLYKNLDHEFSDVYKRACELVENKLDCVVEELKQDRFLGDSDWTVVWRYIPVATSTTYWNRIKYGKIVLANGEEDFSASARSLQNMTLQTLAGKFFSSLSPIHFTRNVKVGCRFDHIPPRLRNKWVQYHKEFGQEISQRLSIRDSEITSVLESNLNRDMGNERYRSMDQTSHYISNHKNLNYGKFQSDALDERLSQIKKSISYDEFVGDRNDDVPKISAAFPTKSRTSVLKELQELKEETSTTRNKLKNIENLLRAAERSAEVAVRNPSARSEPIESFNRREGRDIESLVQTRESYQADSSMIRKMNLKLVSEERLRFITSVKANYVINFKNGYLTKSALQVLLDNADEQLDIGHNDEMLGEWNRLKESFALPEYQVKVVNKLKRLPIIGPFVGGWVFEKLAFMFVLAKNFILAHEKVDVMDILPAGVVTEQLAYENALQLDEAHESLKSQLLAFPEVARSLKTQVSARFLLQKHREIVHELIAGGFIQEWEGKQLLHDNSISLALLHDHPFADYLPPRHVILSKVPFFRQLEQQDIQEIVQDELCCNEQFYGCNVVLLRGGEQSGTSGAAKVLGIGGWYYIVRGTVHMVSQHPQKGQRRQALHAGAIFGMTDEMLGKPYRGTYTTASFVHLYFFNKSRLLELASRNVDLNKGLWRTVAVTLIRKFSEFNRMSLNELHKLIYCSEFLDLSQEGVGQETSEVALRIEEIRSRPLKKTGCSSKLNSPEFSEEDRNIHIRKMNRDTGGNDLRQALKQMGLYEEEQEKEDKSLQMASRRESLKQKTSLKVVEVDSSCYIFVVTGKLLSRKSDELSGKMEELASPCLPSASDGRIILTSNSKVFLIPKSAANRMKKNTLDLDTNFLSKSLKDHTIHRARGAAEPSIMSVRFCSDQIPSLYKNAPSSDCF